MNYNSGIEKKMEQLYVFRKKDVQNTLLKSVIYGILNAYDTFEVKSINNMIMYAEKIHRKIN